MIDMLGASPAFTRAQMTSSTAVAKRFPEVKRRAKEAPQLVMDRNEPESVVLSYEDYEFLYEQAWKLRELENALEQSEVERLYAGRLEDSRWSEGVELQQAAMAALEDRLAGAQNRAAV